MTPYTPEMRAADVRIAKAKGWTEISESPLGYWVGVPPGSCAGQWIDLPRFHESEDARGAVLEWLSADDERWNRFALVFYDLFPPKWEKGLSDYTDSLIRLGFLATPEQVARAADAALRDDDEKHRIGGNA
jgi:hypothetical protein